MCLLNGGRQSLCALVRVVSLVLLGKVHLSCGSKVGEHGCLGHLGGLGWGLCLCHTVKIHGEWVFAYHLLCDFYHNLCTQFPTQNVIKARS